MPRFIVEGGHPLRGEITPAGNKNEALPALAAALLTDEPVTLENVPDILDVRTMLELLSDLGVEITQSDPHTVIVCARELRHSAPRAELSEAIRGSFLLAAPLLLRRGRASLPRPGGDRIGRRRVDTHLAALHALGAEVEFTDRYELQVPQGLQGTELFLDEASVTATENALMAAVLAPGRTTILNAASEPHVQNLCHLLNRMGARIEGIGSNILRIEGVPRLHGCRHRIGSDYLEIGSFIGLAAATRSALTIRAAEPQHLPMIRLVFRRLGVEFELRGTDLYVPAEQELKIRADLHGAIPKIDDAPWPGFPADLISIALVVATQCEGTVLIFEKMFESRLFFVDRL
ncbi:MAG TPA: UDP-N-acetylglucosamine 1-carboxyvinyltransferase, partial [Armatimonadetes bacterium]|nr:UDP-N-acetylglucosamine 1-carboxyvinyltransferase [Armatimonadota bacterium]